jgi:hypothetical protein
MADLHKAIRALYDNVVTIDGEIAYDADNNIIEVDMDQVNAWQNPDLYKEQRVAEYPPIGDQLDALFHAGVFPEEMAAQIQAVKDKYPKE